MDGCPSIDALMAYAEGRLDGTDHEAIEAHVDGCVACASVAAHAAREAHADASAGTTDTPRPDSSESSDDVPPATIGRYAVLQRIGAGGMGVVHGAYDPRLDRVVAIKLIRAGADQRNATARLKREARALATLSHPNVVTVFECGALADRDGVYLVMERVVGETLRRWCARTKRSQGEILGAYLAAAEGLAAAHAAGLIHRDFKPDNVLVGNDGRVRVSDFGLARVFGNAGDDDATNPSGEPSSRSSVAGTPHYMAPEQRAGAEVGPAADQYAFCVALWEALLGERPPGGDSRRLAPRIRRALERGLQSDPRARWPSLDALASALRPRRRPLAWLGAGVLASVVFAGWLATGRPPPAPDARCSAAEARIAAIWSAERRTAIAAVATDAIATDAIAAIDRWAEDWRTRALAACADEPTLLADDGCLELAAVQLDTVLGMIERTAELDVSLRGAIGELPAPQACRRAAVRDADDPGAIAAVRIQLAEAAALAASHRYDGALSIATRAVTDARALDPEVLVEALQRVAKIENSAGRWNEGKATTEEAFMLAESLGLDATAAELAISRVFNAAFIERDYAGAQDWARHAASVIDRLDPATQPLARARLLAAEARTSEGLGHYREAERRITDALEILEHSDRVDPAELGALYNGLASAQLAHDQDAALANYEHALTVVRAWRGELHPEVGMLINNIGGLHYLRGETELAASRLGEAARLLEVVLGDRHPQVAAVYMNYGMALGELGDGLAARGSLRHAIELFERAHGPDHPDVAMARNNLGAVELDDHDYDAAEREFRRALTILEVAVGAEHESCAYSLRGLAEVAIARGQGQLAVDFAARAVAIDERIGKDPIDHASNLLQLAKAQRLAGDELAAAATARDALARLREAAPAGESDTELIGELEAFGANGVNAAAGGSD